MSIREFTVPASADDLLLAVAVAAPEDRAEGRPEGIFQIVHGMCEHKERYYPFMEWMASQGYACIIHDQRGHGASVKGRGDLGYLYAGGWNAMVEDVAVVADAARRMWGDIDFTLLGHSMGSMVVRSFLKRHDALMDRLIVCGSPSDNPAKGAGKALAWLYGSIMGWHFRPQLLQKMSFGAYNRPFAAEGWPNAWVCSDQEVLKAYHSDPLCSYVFTANGFFNLMGLMQDCYGDKGWNVENPSLPIRFISGAQDPCRTSDADFNDAVDFIRQRGYNDVEGRLYEGMRHEILNETDRLTVWNDILRMVK